MKKITLLSLTFLLAACSASPTPTPVTVAGTNTVTPIVVEATSTPSPMPPMTVAPPTVTLVPSPTSFPSKISSMDGMTQLFVAEGSVYMGGLDVLLENDELPAHTVQLDAFWVDQVEVTNGMYGLCVQAGVCRSPVTLNSDNRAEYFGTIEFQDYPVVNVTWYDANVYCQWAGRRLPTEAEWERAARGDDMRTYPWGSASPSEVYVNSDNSVGDTSRVGSYPAGASPFGVLDMAGNVWEWVFDYYAASYYEKSSDTNPSGPEDGGLNYLRVIRGGGFQDNFIGLRVSNRGYEVGPDPFALPNEDSYYGKSSVKIGFRCVQSD